jgi:hypothetical protein
MPGSSEIRVDLHAVVDKLLLLKGDLQAYVAALAGDGDLHQVRRIQIAIAIRQLSERALTLEDLVMRFGVSGVVLTGTRVTVESVRSAMHVFERLEAIDDAEPFDDVVSCLIGILHATDVVCLRAAGGRPDTEARRDVRIERLARAGGSSGIVLARIGPIPSACADDEDARTARSAGR